ncbi:MAG: SHOCT domain-containing protein [Hoeflea sp.]|uniref:SHOCT domain-containing protein n=1 Tax=Hoeflea sp. TaxID=1940281 RepID=UPI003EF29418
MTQLTEDGRKALAEIASRRDVSPEAVEHVAMALMAGHGTQAQFNHPDLGGMGQWSLGGMTMVGDMFNNSLKAKVDAICSDVAQLMRQSDLLRAPSQSSSQSQSQGDAVSLFVGAGSTGNWWPTDLGHAASTGAQNQMRYAWFPDTARLAVDAGDGRVRVYDTADHRIGGFSQQQSGGQSLSFTSQYGLVKLADLHEVDLEQSGGAGTRSVSEKSAPALSDALLKAATGSLAAEPSPADKDPAPSEFEQTQPDTQRSETLPASAPVEEADIFAKIERLAALHSKGILSDQEYQSKKAELLARI